MTNKAFDELSIEEKKDWWLKQAYWVLNQHFNIHDASVKWLSYTHNAVFDVSIPDHAYHWVLRMQRPENAGNLASEIEILRLIRKHGLTAPFPEQSINLDTVSALLLTKLEGVEQIVHEVTNSEIQSIGVFFANFHEIKVSQSPNRPNLDYSGLFSKNGIYYPGEKNMQVFTPEQLSVMDAVAEKVKQAMDELGQCEAEFGLIHGDLLLKNILFHEGEVRALDFEYCGWGYYLYDLTPLLWQLKPQERYLHLEQALWDGYTSIRPLTKRHRGLLETFIAGRQVASMRWIAANQQNPHVVGKVEAILTQRTAELQDFLETGILNRS